MTGGMDVHTVFAVLLLIGAVLVRLSAGLQCYQCSSTTGDNPCVNDVSQLVHDKENDGTFSKNCTIERNQAFCMIEFSHSKGHLTTFIRDCSDGETFSFDNIKRLQHIVPTNQTTCSTFGTSGTIVCMSLCYTNFCNGPQMPSATGKLIHSSATGFMLVVYMLFM